MEYHHPNTIPEDHAFEVITVTERKVVCDGGGGPLGHPRVFLKMELDEHSVTCPYCSRTYMLESA